VPRPHGLCRGLSREESDDRVIEECQACGNTPVEPFFTVDRTPVSSCTLSATWVEASEFERGALELAVCNQCAFIQNRRFEPKLVDYTLGYEESQAFSPRFLEFQRDLVTRLTEDHELSGKTVLEIGAGKGDFLEALCLASGARGIGIDPAGDFSRVKPGLDLTLIREVFDESKTHLTGDLICCRHTLEHVQPVREFVGNVARSLRQTDGSVAFFELPDTQRILQAGAYWDVYYEHCSYFTPASLGHLFRSCGLETIGLELGFDDQYLLLEARADEAEGSPDPTAVQEIVEMCRQFGAVAGREVGQWRGLVAECSALDEVVVLWGAGSKAVGFLSALELDEAITAVVDVNPFKQGTFLPGSAHEIISPQKLREISPDLVVVMNPVYAGEIRQMLDGLGLNPRLETLGAVAQ
jgi:2-polyprenyl-3-methyl-5-hydroxy-6-metoxy-1,4-benzoquinol methylase